jgi:hypothetical protein
MENDAGRIDHRAQRRSQQNRQAPADFARGIRRGPITAVQQCLTLLAEHGARRIAYESMWQLEIFQLPQELIDRRKRA